MIAAVLCTGPSMNRETVEACNGAGMFTVAVKDVCYLAPCNAVAAADSEWWVANDPPTAEWFCKMSNKKAVVVPMPTGTDKNTCSGVLGLEVAYQKSAKTILLLGADFHDHRHFDGYKEVLDFSTQSAIDSEARIRREKHLPQFRAWKEARPDVRVINCTPDSALDVFERGDMEDWIK